MRIYQNCYELYSEMLRDLWEMGITVYPKSYQNKIIEGNENFVTKEIQNYIYTLTSLGKVNTLFLFSGEKSRDWADAEFQERIQPYNFKNPGKAWEIRKSVWKEFLNEKGEFDYTYNERITYNLISVVRELEKNPGTRQTWLPIFWEEDPVYLGGKKRIPCSLGYFFSIRGGQLDLCYIQRSADIVLHLGNDIYLAWRLMEYVAGLLKIKTGYLTHHIFSLHAYKRDWLKLESGISNL